MESIGHFQNSNITIVAEKIVASGVVIHWLFVRIDSIGRSQLQQTKQRIDERLQEVEHWWGPEGLWAPNVSILRFIAAKILVPFCAAYLFPQNVSHCEVPRYDLTTDAQKFDGPVPQALMDDVKRLNALGYLSDGDGLSYYLIDDRIAEVVAAHSSLDS